MTLNLIFHIYDFHDLKIVNKIFFFIFEGGLKFLSRGVLHNIVSKVGDRHRGWPEGLLFDSYYTKI